METFPKYHESLETHSSIYLKYEVLAPKLTVAKKPQNPTKTKTKKQPSPQKKSLSNLNYSILWWLIARIQQ